MIFPCYDMFKSCLARGMCVFVCFMVLSLAFGCRDCDGDGFPETLGECPYTTTTDEGGFYEF